MIAIRRFLYAMLLLAISANASLAVEPRPVFKNPKGTKVEFMRSVDYQRKAKNRYEVPQEAADKIIEIANQIEMRQRPVRVLRSLEAPLGSFYIGEKTWLHLLRQGVLEDPAHQGVQNKALKRLADQINANYDNLSDKVFLDWAEYENSADE